MFLAVDIGNTRITFGVFDEHGQLQKKWDESSLKESSLYSSRGNAGIFACSDSAPRALAQGRALRCELAAKIPASLLMNSRIGLASVVPDLTPSVVDFFKSKYPGISLTEISVELNTGLEFCVENSKEIGADRIANCTYAFNKYRSVNSPGMAGRSLLIIDMGTAITFDCVTSKGEYLGGLIYPGIETSFKNLFEKAARLQPIHLEKPHNLVGKNTRQHVQSGYYYGTKSLMNGLINEYKRELGDLFVIATGGHSHLLLTDPLFNFDVVDPDLTLKGIHFLCAK
ncbi:MAG: type III pantothenate kinase [Deltaproteobacteria bacterium]|nr:type III pantothenate kinase [Deltaproteobacteria bacterium]